MIRIAILALALMASPAFAEDWQQNFFGHSSTYRNPDEHRHHRHHVPRPIVIHRKPEVRSWIKRDFVPDRNIPVATCFSPVRTVGDQAITIDGAKGEAIKAWSQMVRHDHGERAMDFDVSREGTFACVRSSIGSVGGASFHRCELIARPCTATHTERER